MTNEKKDKSWPDLLLKKMKEVIQIDLSWEWKKKLKKDEELFEIMRCNIIFSSTFMLLQREEKQIQWKK